MNVEVVVGPELGPVREAILAGLSAFNEKFLGPTQHAEIVVTVRDERGRLVGGVAGHVYRERLFVDLVWIDEAHRGRGLGSRAVREFEAEGRRRGATRALLDTMSFQAAPFYEKLGYVEAARIRGFFGEYDRIYMTREL